MSTAPPRGTRDLLALDGARIRALYDRAAALASTYGYGYVETPGFEATELFTQTSGSSSDVVAKEMYTFQDRGGRWVTLRPEGTAPVMRAYLHQRHDLGSPFKAYYLTRMYRYSRPQTGRYREHRQFGIEVFGTDDPTADVEVMAVGDRFLRELGLGAYEVHLNSIGDEVCRPVFRDLLTVYLAERAGELTDEHRDRFAKNPLRVLDCKDEACRAVAAQAPRITDHLCEACAAHLAAVRAGLTEAGIAATLVPTLVRGLDYYTRTAFEFVATGLSAQQGTLFGGGRYDGLAEALGGPHVPGVGFGMGLERVLLALEAEEVEPPRAPALDVFVVALGDAAASAARSIVAELRSAGVSADGSFGDRPMKAQMKHADRVGALHAAIIGDRELAEGVVTLRRMTDGQQRSVPVGELAQTLAGAVS
jgi:histidyl-tRNA synthetase